MIFCRYIPDTWHILSLFYLLIRISRRFNLCDEGKEHGEGGGESWNVGLLWKNVREFDRDLFLHERCDASLDILYVATSTELLKVSFRVVSHWVRNPLQRATRTKLHARAIRTVSATAASLVIILQLEINRNLLQTKNAEKCDFLSN